ncbi:MAG TPA: hypothetical protein VJ723_00130 [Candidatus Angelobacter sp.]|nr:hypothetical protein [Candidatus Angelobacter sp.]
MPIKLKWKWDAITAVASLAVAITGAAALIYARSQIEQAQRQAQAENLQKQEERFFDSPKMLQTRKTLACSRLTQDRKSLNKLDLENPPPELYDVMSFFETVGLLTRKKALDANDIWNEFGYWIENYYMDSRGVIERSHAEGVLYWYDEFVRLADVNADIDKKNGGGGVLTTEDLRKFYIDECDSLSSGATARKRKKK